MIAALERAIAARIRSATFGYALGTVSSYDEAVEQIDSGVLQLPACWVTYEGEDNPAREDDGVYNRTMEFAIHVAAAQWVNVGFTRGIEATGMPGAYQICDDLWFLLADCDLGFDNVGYLHPGAIRPDVPEPGVTICRMEFTCQVTAIPPETGGDLADYLRHHIDWDFPPLGNVEPPLPTEVADDRDDLGDPLPEPDPEPDPQP